MWSDNETDRDLLNFEGVADTVAELIAQAERRPISIGVSGAWGAGKSSMIKLTRASLARDQEEGEPAKYLFVEFNAWLYQGYDDARAALLDVIAGTLEEEARKRETALDKVADFVGRVRWLRLAKLIAIPAASVALGIPPVGLLGPLVSLLQQGVAGNVDVEGLEGAEKTIDPATKAVTGLLAPKAMTSPPKEIQALRDSFESALAELGVTLVVLIDDLDRCLPETAISTLEAIRLFLFLKGTAFVIAADEDMIRYAVRKHFGGLDDDALVTSYFDKLIQVPIRVPSLGIQEVRAYLFMLFVDDSELQEEQKNAIRTAVSTQLRQSWQGKRVDRAFMQALEVEFPQGLIARLETAERIAPILSASDRISGNPRLVKRFLNAASIRVAISKAQGVGVDEAVLTKLLLFERLGPETLYREIVAASISSEDGHPTFLASYESEAGQLPPDLPEAWDTPFVRDWLSLPPALADKDLRGALYVSREHALLTSDADRLASDSVPLLQAMLENPEGSQALKEDLLKVPISDIGVMMDRVLERAQKEQDWGAPPILEACLVLAEVDPAQAPRLAAFLAGRPSAQIAPSIVPRISDAVWAVPVLQQWKDMDGISAPVKKAIGQVKTNGNIAKQ